MDEGFEYICEYKLTDVDNKKSKEILIALKKTIEKLKHSGVGTAEHYLKIAAKHLQDILTNAIKKKALVSPGSQLDDVIVVVIFSAASIETALNHLICVPILYIKEAHLRTFFGLLITKYLRLSVPQKIEFLCDLFPKIKADKKLRKKVEDLFQYRNRLIHASYEYVEGWDLRDDIGDGTLKVEDFILKPFLIPKREISIFNVYEYYKTAADFFKMIPKGNLRELKKASQEYYKCRLTCLKKDLQE